MATYEKDAKTGNVYLKTVPAFWTPEAWWAEVKRLEDRLALAQDQLVSAMPDKEKPDADTLVLWNSMAAEQRRPLEEEVARLQAEIEEMKMKAI